MKLDSWTVILGLISIALFSSIFWQPLEFPSLIAFGVVAVLFGVHVIHVKTTSAMAAYLVLFFVAFTSPNPAGPLGARGGQNPITGSRAIGIGYVYVIFGALVLIFASLFSFFGRNPDLLSRYPVLDTAAYLFIVATVLLLVAVGIIHVRRVRRQELAAAAKR